MGAALAAASLAGAWLAGAWLAGAWLAGAWLAGAWLAGAGVDPPLLHAAKSTAVALSRESRPRRDIRSSFVRPTRSVMPDLRTAALCP